MKQVNTLVQLFHVFLCYVYNVVEHSPGIIQMAFHKAVPEHWDIDMTMLTSIGNLWDRSTLNHSKSQGFNQVQYKPIL